MTEDEVMTRKVNSHIERIGNLSKKRKFLKTKEKLQKETYDRTKHPDHLLALEFTQKALKIVEDILNKLLDGAQ